MLTTGLILKESSEVIRAEGGIITDAVVFLDREEGGDQTLERNGAKLDSLLKISEIAKSLFDIGAIDDQRLKTILK